MRGILTAPQSRDGAASRFGMNIARGLERRWGKSDMTAYQKAQLEREQKAEERKIALGEIANIDLHAAQLEKQGSPEAAQALLQSNKNKITKYQPWRIASGGKVLPAYDAVVLATTQLEDESKLIAAQRKKGYLERTEKLKGDPIAATQQLEDSIDKVTWTGSMIKAGIVPSADAAFGASLSVSTQAMLEIDKQLARYPKDPTTGEIIGTDEQRAEVENLERLRGDYAGQRQGIMQLAPQNVVKQVEAALISEFEKGDEEAPIPAEAPLPTQEPTEFEKLLIKPTAGGVGRTVRGAVAPTLRHLTPSGITEGMIDTGTLLRNLITGASSAVGEAFGVGEAPSVEEQDRALAEALYKAGKGISGAYGRGKEFLGRLAKPRPVERPGMMEELLRKGTRPIWRQGR